MKQRIKDWIYAYKVCKRYGVFWNLFRRTSLGAEYSITVYKNNMTGRVVGKKRVISINPFYENFISSFMHEVGHLFSDERGYSKKLRMNASMDEYDWNSYPLKGSEKLIEEAKAWRFSRKAVQGRFNKDHAMWCFKTYTASHFKSTTDHINSVDVVYKCMRSIEK